MPKEMTYDQKAMMHGLSELQAIHHDAVMMWKLLYKYVFGIDIDVLSAPVEKKPEQGDWRLVAVYKLSPWASLDALKKFFPMNVKYDHKMFIDMWSERDFGQPLHFFWVPDRLTLTAKQSGYLWTLEECLADEVMFQFQKRLSGDLGFVNPSLIGDIHEATMCLDTRFKDSSIPQVYRNSESSGDYHIHAYHPVLIPEETGPKAA